MISPIDLLNDLLAGDLSISREDEWVLKIEEGWGLKPSNQILYNVLNIASRLSGRAWTFFSEDKTKYHAFVRRGTEFKIQFVCTGTLRLKKPENDLVVLDIDEIENLLKPVESKTITYPTPLVLKGFTTEQLELIERGELEVPLMEHGFYSKFSGTPSVDGDFVVLDDGELELCHVGRVCEESA